MNRLRIKQIEKRVNGVSFINYEKLTNEQIEKLLSGEKKLNIDYDKLTDEQLDKLLTAKSKIEIERIVGYAV